MFPRPNSTLPPLPLPGDVWKGFEIDQGGTLETEGLEGFKEKIYVACAEREKHNLRKETKDKEGLEVYGMLKEGTGSRSTYTDKWTQGQSWSNSGPGTSAFENVDGDKFKCPCDAECEDRVYLVAEFSLYAYNERKCTRLNCNK
ncbi:unnamed protein product [Ectocarpus sp. 13 AM-2016]